MGRAVIVTLYNPGAAGARYVASSLKAAGHDVWLLHFKEFRSVGVPNHDLEAHKALESDRLLYVKFLHPGQTVYAPYPTPITEIERGLLISEIHRLAPDLVAFSMFTVTVDIARGLTDLIHKELPGLPVLWGGIHCLLEPEHCVQTADIVCTGEGEDAAVELMNRWGEYKEKGALDTDGLWFRRDGDIVRNPSRPLIEDLDRLPFPTYGAQELLIDDDCVSDMMASHAELFRTGMQTLVFTERGCPYHCSYCVHSLLNLDKAHARFRRRSVDNVLDECEQLLGRHGLRHFIFHDEIFLIQKSWVREFAAKFKERFASRGCAFTGYVHPLTTDAEMLDLMWDAGLRRTGMGVQSGSRRVTEEVFHRVWCPDRTIALSRLLAKYPFEIVQYDLLTHNPFETERERRETFEFLLQLEPPFSVETFGLVVYPTCKMAEMTPLSAELDRDEMLFCNMLYFLSGVPGLDRQWLRSLADNAHYRRNPRDLENLTLEMLRLNEERNRLRRETASRRVAPRIALQPIVPDGLRSRLVRLLERIVP